MAYDYSRLLGKIVEKFKTRANFAEAMQMSKHSVSVKLNSKAEWKQCEILRAADLLEIEHNDIPMYFFTLKVQY